MILQNVVLPTEKGLIRENKAAQTMKLSNSTHNKTDWV